MATSNSSASSGGSVSLFLTTPTSSPASMSPVVAHHPITAATLGARRVDSLETDTSVGAFSGSHSAPPTRLTLTNVRMYNFCRREIAMGQQVSATPDIHTIHNVMHELGWGVFDRMLFTQRPEKLQAITYDDELAELELNTVVLKTLTETVGITSLRHQDLVADGWSVRTFSLVLTNNIETRNHVPIWNSIGACRCGHVLPLDEKYDMLDSSLELSLVMNMCRRAQYVRMQQLRQDMMIRDLQKETCATRENVKQKRMSI